MSTAELRAHIVHRLEGVSETDVLEEINAMLDFKVAEPVFRCTAEQRDAIRKVQQSVAKGECVSHKEMKNAVELWLSEN